MKRLYSLFLILVICLGILCINTYSAETVAIWVNDEPLEGDQSAIMSEGKTLVPLRAISEALNCTVTWNEETKATQIQNEIVTISVAVNNPVLTRTSRINPYEVKQINLDVAPCVINGRTFVPIRGITDALNAKIEWNGHRKRVDVTMEFDYVCDFNEFDVAEVKKAGKYGIIDRNHKVVAQPVYDRIDDFSEGLAPVVKDGKWGYIDSKGKLAVPVIYDRTYAFYNGLGMILKGEKFGMVNAEGKVIVERVYGSISKFNNGLACVEKNGKYGYINTAGKEIVPVMYENIGAFSEGLAPMCINGKWGYVNTAGKTAISIMYDVAGDFHNGSAYVTRGGEGFYIDKTGMRIK